MLNNYTEVETKWEYPAITLFTVSQRWTYLVQMYQIHVSYAEQK